MRIVKADNFNKFERIGFILIYVILFANAFFTKDSNIALVSAICGITYTILAGKGIPVCYPIGAFGSFLYAFLSFKSALWGNLALYAGYYIPMQIMGYFHWKKHLKEDKNEIVKTSLSRIQRIKFFAFTAAISGIVIAMLYYLGDKSPVIDGITTVFSILGMYFTVRRYMEQWVVWIIVNGLSLIMWLKIALSGVKVYSTVIMWAVYLCLAIYFHFVWKKEVQQSE